MAQCGTDKTALAERAWAYIFDFIIATGGQRNQVLARLGLTPNDARALGGLDEMKGRTLRSLANEWESDASTTTWIVDRLETKGLVERRSHPTDRRAKWVVLTPLGVKVKADLLAGTYTPPPELLELDETDLTALCDALAKLPSRNERKPA